MRGFCRVRLSSMSIYKAYPTTPDFIETPDGVETTFTVATPFIIGTLTILHGGMVTTDFTTPSTTSVTFGFAPLTGESIVIQSGYFGTDAVSASDYFSSETTISNRVKAARLKLWGDRNRDDILDPDTLTQGLVFAKAQILASLENRYGSQIEEWDITTVPNLLKQVSDALTIYYIASGTNAVNEVVKDGRTDAMQTLSALANYEMSLPDVSDSGSYDTVTAHIESIFDNDDTLQDEIDEETNL